jgi:hypothetical protein
MIPTLLMVVDSVNAIHLDPQSKPYVYFLPESILLHLVYLNGSSLATLHQKTLIVTLSPTRQQHPTSSYCNNESAFNKSANDRGIDGSPDIKVI